MVRTNVSDHLGGHVLNDQEVAKLAAHLFMDWGMIL